MATTILNPDGVLLGTSETTVYHLSGAPTGAIVTVRANNVDTASRTLNMWLYSTALSGTDATLMVPKNYALAAGTQVELGPFHLNNGYKITGTSDSANKINVIPTGLVNT